MTRPSLNLVEPTDDVPEKIMLRLREFLVDRKTGNLQLNVRNGHILGLTIEEKVSFKAED